MLSKAFDNREISPTPSVRVMQSVRSKILTGAYAAGDRLPTNRGLTEEHQVSLLTIQRAMALLQSDGFIETRGRAGTFVAAAPPHLSRYGLAFLSHPFANDGSWTRFHTALEAEAINARMPNGKRFVSYHHLYNREATNPSQIELTQDVESHRLAGLILVGQAHMVESHTRQLAPELPRVCIDRSGDLAVPAIVPDFIGWLERAFQWLKQQGRQRIAMIELQVTSPGITDTSTVERFVNMSKAYGATPDPLYYVPANKDTQLAMTQSIQLLMSLPKERRPDAFIINDDNLLDRAVHGLLTSHASIGPDADVQVVAHANFPHMVSSASSIHYLGYDTRAILDRAVQALDEQRTVALDQHAQGLEISVPAVTQAEFLQMENPLMVSAATSQRSVYSGPQS